MADPLFSDALGAELGDLSVELERIDDLADGVSRSLSRAFRGAVLDGRSLNGVLGDIARSFSNIALKAAFKPVGELVGGLVGNLFAATDPALAGVQPFAKGGVLASPSYFPLGQGLGVAGEAGPEAILPLSRGSDGRLGVAAGGSAPIQVTFNVTTSDARSFAASEAEISAMLLRAVKRGARGT
jgi:phage-related minor tail protein